MLQASMIPSRLMPANGKVDIFAVHTILNLAEHKKVLEPNSVYVTALRNPADLFESLYNYFGLNTHYKMGFEQFATNLPQVRNTINTFHIYIYLYMYIILKNISKLISVGKRIDNKVTISL